MFYAAKIVMIVSGIWRMELPTESNFWITAYRTYSTVAKILLSTTVFALGAKFPALLEKDALADQAIRVLNTGTCNLSVNIFIETVLLFLRAQLIILQEQFRSFHKGADEAPIANADQVNHQGLKKLCISHRKLIYFLASFNDSLKFIMLLEYVASSLIIASSILEVLGGHNVPFNAGFVVTNFGGLMLLSWNCNEIMVQSVKLATALYESKWYEQDKQSNALLQIMMIRSQKPLVITIGSFGPMTLDAGMSRMRLAYSYTTVLGSNF
ncbi:odorant receptor 30a-like isoform X2 [Cylas formicarius]|uniref:odorant receptor 30a-like isoform X2 n=1 Tax=Cylas formicarius TaxID=197179 RepID=UPI0029583FEF|nr:odorant receptor 30a-like isoform X2 [Cylas formicarius]